MNVRGEHAIASPKEQVTVVMNLSGKKTRAGRISGECCMQLPKRKAILYGKLSGTRTEISLSREISVLFLFSGMDRLAFLMEFDLEEEHSWNN